MPRQTLPFPFSTHHLSLSQLHLTSTSSIQKMDFSSANVPVSRDTWAPRSPPSGPAGDRDYPPPSREGYDSRAPPPVAAPETDRSYNGSTGRGGYGSGEGGYRGGRGDGGGGGGRGGYDRPIIFILPSTSSLHHCLAIYIIVYLCLAVYIYVRSPLGRRVLYSTSIRNV
ncbi:hypothetical protein BCR39DRAFT_234980 [Naematelia encephala]|uniref:Uncharacterized protein n=1 Tax=Naematelia encephala TaxID=71784 RepID=A0A1Y2BH41_9TREE|nr:hypothetical protein BCR39DRAFT_234980 [Naematelia encephala]